MLEQPALYNNFKPVIIESISSLLRSYVVYKIYEDFANKEESDSAISNFYNFITYLSTGEFCIAMLHKLTSNNPALYNEAISSIIRMPILILISAVAQNAINVIQEAEKSIKNDPDDFYSKNIISSYNTNDQLFLKIVDTTAKSFISCTGYVMVKPYQGHVIDKVYTMILGLGFVGSIAKSSSNKIALCDFDPYCFCDDKKVSYHDHSAVNIVKYSIRTGMYISFMNVIDGMDYPTSVTLSGFISSIITLPMRAEKPWQTHTESLQEQCKYVISYTLDSFAYSQNVGSEFLINAFYSALHENVKLFFLNKSTEEVCISFAKFVSQNIYMNDTDIKLYETTIDHNQNSQEDEMSYNINDEILV